MSLVSGGFVFLILPMLAAGYYILNDKLKPWWLILFSIFFLLDIPNMPPVLLGNVAVNWAVLIFCEKKTLYGETRKKLNNVLLIKDFLILLFFFAWGYFTSMESIPSTVFAVMLFSIFGVHASCSISGEKERGSREYLRYVFFFPKFYAGPFELPRHLKQESRRFKPSPMLLAGGVMIFSTGVAKRVIIVRHLEIISTTLLKFTLTETTVLSIWFLCLVYALEFYFTVSAYGDMARGISGLFSLRLPQITYYPLQSPTVRDYIYRFNLGLEQSLGEIIFKRFDRDKDIFHGYIISGMVIILFSGIFAPFGITPMWCAYMLLLLIPDSLILRRASAKLPMLSRILTFLMILPSFLFVSGASQEENLFLLKIMLGIDKVPFFTDSLFYLSISDLVILLLACALSLSFMELGSRLMKKQFPMVWWIFSAMLSMGTLVFCASFILMEVV